jgi:hypothetical protein
LETPGKKRFTGTWQLFSNLRGVTIFGENKGTQHKHWLTIDESVKNFIYSEIHEATIERFKRKAGDKTRVLTNTAASQAYCFNLIIHLQKRQSLADKLFSKLLGKQVKVNHLEPEFTPGPNNCDKIIGFELPQEIDETIGDQASNQGTDADIAIFYTYENNKKGLLLIEFKFIEAEFSICSSYRKKEKIKQVCISKEYFPTLIEKKKRDAGNNFFCGYNKYFNWDLTKKSKVMDIDQISSMPCPFRLGLNQLWRNMILAEQVSSARNCDEFGFWVFSPKENDKYLWHDNEIEKQFRAVLTEKGNNHFKKIHLETILDHLQVMVEDGQDKSWLTEMERKYRIA